MQRVNGQTVTTPRSSALVSRGKYFTKSPPTFQEYSASQVLNIKNVEGRPVYGDGTTDDTQNINDILADSAGCSVIYFPAGTYMVTDTIFVPAGRRIVGDSFASVISAVGVKFQNPAAVRPMVKFGYPGDVGVAQVTDMMFTVGDILPGCKMVSIIRHRPISILTLHDSGRSEHRRRKPWRCRILEHPYPSWWCSREQSREPMCRRPS